MAEPNPDVVRIPTPLALAETQMLQALQMSRDDFRDLPHLTMFPSAMPIIGPMIPSDLWTVGARTGNGKTTFLLNLFEGLVERRLPTLFLTTEISAAQMRRQWAALRLGFRPDYVLENAWHLLPPGAQEMVDGDVKYQCEHLPDVGLFHDLPRLDASGVRKALKEYAIGARYSIVILDHINRWIPRDGSQKTQELTEAVQGFKEVAMKHKLCVILAAQISRGQDRNPLADFLPPPLSALQQTSALEQESSVVIMLHRQRKADATAAMMKEVVNGQREAKDLLEEGVMCMSVGKHRRRGSSVGRMIRLKVAKGGKLEDEMTEQVRQQFEATQAVPAPREPGEEPEQELPF